MELELRSAAVLYWTATTPAANVAADDDAAPDAAALQMQRLVLQRRTGRAPLPAPSQAPTQTVRPAPAPQPRSCGTVVAHLFMREFVALFDGVRRYSMAMFSIC